MALSSHHHPFKLCTGHTWRLLTQLKGIYAAWYPCQNFTDSKFIPPNKHEMQNLLEEMLQLDGQ